MLPCIPNRNRRWRGWLPLSALFLSTALSTSAAFADMVRITSVNGTYDSNHESVIDVRPGDVVTLSADLFTDNYSGTYTPQNRFVEDFTWYADDAAPQGGVDECDASQNQNQSCLSTSNFEVNNYGVSFYVPYTLGASTTLTVRSHSDSNAVADTIILRNASYVESGGNYQPPTEVVTEPDQYQNQGGYLDPNAALAGQGRWVFVNGIRYFVPYSYQPDWVPYQNGYWAWTDDGWTWVSNDPWGWMTDHYGIWRHHSIYGWIWRAFEDFRYRPHCVTWFHDEGGYIGWYPYYDGYRAGYAHGYDAGFNDGYWAGYQAGRYYGGAGFYPGFTVVRYGAFGARNIYEQREAAERATNAWRNGYGRNQYGAYPGGASDMHGSRGWVDGHCGAYPTTSMGSRSFGGGHELRFPVRVYPAPESFSRLPYAVGGNSGRAFPVGSVFRPTSGGTIPGGRPNFTPPTNDGRGIALPPQIYDPKRGTYQPLPPRTQRPVVANPNNPVYRPIAGTPGQPVVLPPHQPGVPGPRPQPPVINPPAPRPQPPVYNPPAPRPQPPVVNPPAPRPQPPVYNPPAPRPQPPVYNPPAPRPQPPVYNPPAPRPQPPVYNPPAPRPQPPVYNPPAPRPQPPVYNPPAPRPQPPVYNPPAPRPQPPMGPRPGMPGHGPHMDVA
ncbi:DUF6600 domain-containing protein [Bdellovibrionota bacterium FG-1]